MVLLPCGNCCTSPVVGCVLTGFTNGLTAFNLASGLSKSYEQSAARFSVTSSYDDSVGGDSRLRLVLPGMPVYLRHTLGSNDALPQEVSTGTWANMVQMPGDVSGFAAPNQASVSFRADGAAIEMRLLMYLRLPYGNSSFPSYQTQQVQVIYRKQNQQSFFEAATVGAKIVFEPADVISFSVASLDAGAPSLSFSQSDVGSVTVGFLGSLDLMFGEFVVTVTAQTPAYSFADTTSFSPSTKTIVYDAAGFSGVPLQTYTYSTLSFGGSNTVANCTRWSAKLRWGSISSGPTLYALYVLFGGATNTWKSAYEQACLYATTTFNAGLTNVAFALLKVGNTVNVTLPPPYWPSNSRTYWHASPGFGMLGSVFLTETGFDFFFGGYETALGVSPVVRQGLPFRHGIATMTVTRP